MIFRAQAAGTDGWVVQVADADGAVIVVGQILGQLVGVHTPNAYEPYSRTVAHEPTN